MFRKSTLFICVLFIVSNTFASPSIDTLPKRKVQVIPLPVAFYIPETKFGGGIVANMVFKASNDINIKPSTVNLVALYTQRKQAVLKVPYQLFLNKNKIFMYGEFGYSKYIDKYFGIRDQERRAENYETSYPIVRFNGYSNIYKKLFAGIKFHYQKITFVEKDSSGALLYENIRGSNGSAISSIGASVLWDGRNNVFYPTNGFYVDVSYSRSIKQLGASDNFNTFLTNITNYEKLYKETILASHIYFSVQNGQVPFSFLNFIGGANKGRGYFEGRVRSENMLSIEEEIRMKVYKRWGAVVFGGLHYFGTPETFLFLNNLYPNYGAGIRFIANRKEHLNIRADIGFGKRNSRGVYITVLEAF